MAFQFSPWTPALVLGIIVTLILAVSGWKRRRSPGGLWFFLFMVALAWWQLFEILELCAVPLELKILFAQIMYFAVTSVALLFFLFCFEYGEFQIRVPAPARFLLWIPPLFIVVLAFTNSSHRLVWTAFTPVSGTHLAIYDYASGPALWLLVGYSYALLLGATIILLSLVFSSRKPVRRPAFWMILGTLAPWIGNIADLLGHSPRSVDLTPVSFLLSGIFFSQSMFRYRFLNIAPAAYGSIFDYMTDAVIVFDTEYKVVDANPAAGTLFSITRSDCGKTIEAILAPWPDFRSRMEMLQASTGTRSLTIARGGEWLETRLFNLYDGQGGVRGRFLIVRDVTEAKRVEEERAASLERLQLQRRLLHEISLSAASAEGDFPRAAREITEMMNRGLGTERSSLWLGNAREGLIRCLDLYEASTGLHSPGPVLVADRYPRYFEAMARDRVIDASDAAADPRTREFSDGYLQSFQIGSLLDAPIRVAGTMAGLVSFEHVGPPRRWKEDEIRFAAETADAAAQAYANWERRKIEDDRRESEERFRMLVEAAPDAIIVEAEGAFSYLNAAALRHFGIAAAEQILGRPLLDSVHPDDRGRVREKLRMLNEEKAHVPAEEERLLRFDGTVVVSESSAVPIRYRGLDGGLVFIRDVTERKRSEEALKASVEEKVVLLREIQNRVRSNMQIVLSLLNHQAGAVADPELRRAFTASRDRIRAISLVQDKLYRSEDLSRIDFAEYVRDLIIHLFHVYQIEPDRIRCVFDLSPVFFDVQLSIPLGIIINEIILNALRYAFPGKRKGEIQVKLAKKEDESFVLEIRDDGVGIPGQVDLARASTLGFQLIGMLIEQIDGRIKVETQGGVSFAIAFSERPDAG